MIVQWEHNAVDADSSAYMFYHALGNLCLKLQAGIESFSTLEEHSMCDFLQT